VPTINIDDLESTKPILITIDGKEYEVQPITVRLLDKMNAILSGEDKKAGKGRAAEPAGITPAHRQLGLFLGVPAETFINVDLRKVKAAVREIDRAWNGAMEELAENPTGAAEG